MGSAPLVPISTMCFSGSVISGRSRPGDGLVDDVAYLGASGIVARAEDPAGITGNDRGARGACTPFQAKMTGLCPAGVTPRVHVNVTPETVGRQNAPGSNSRERGFCSPLSLWRSWWLRSPVGRLASCCPGSLVSAYRSVTLPETKAPQMKLRAHECKASKGCCQERAYRLRFLAAFPGN
jgi:hypothetical protein